MSRLIKNIIIHCADTPNGTNFSVADIDQWHRERGWHRTPEWRQQFNPELTSIGYHFVIYIDGSVHTGRQADEVGAHCSGVNSESIGVCLIGDDKFRPAQWASLKELLGNLMRTYPGAQIKGHYQFPSAVAQGKHCPNFDVPAYVADGFTPDDRHILT